jgi:uncharacterized protein DUF5684
MREVAMTPLLASLQMPPQPMSPSVAAGWVIAVVIIIAAMWRVFIKAGKPGWAAIVPVYNLIVLLQVAGKPVWWVLLLFIPLVNIIVFIVMYAGVARNFGKGIGFTLGLIFLAFIFFPILAWGSAEYSPQG